MIMPDFFGGKPWPVDDFPPKSDESKQKLQEFFGGMCVRCGSGGRGCWADLERRRTYSASPPANLERLVKLAETLKGEGYQHIGVYGFCWGACAPATTVTYQLTRWRAQAARSRCSPAPRARSTQSPSCTPQC